MVFAGLLANATSCGRAHGGDVAYAHSEEVPNERADEGTAEDRMRRSLRLHRRHAAIRVSLTTKIAIPTGTAHFGCRFIRSSLDRKPLDDRTAAQHRAGEIEADRVDGDAQRCEQRPEDLGRGSGDEVEGSRADRKLELRNQEGEI